MSSAIVEVIEQDSQDIEDIPNLLEFLLPSSVIMNTCSQFSLHYKRTIFDSWQKQPSACCGAASVAGAWNALSHMDRRNSNSLNHRDVLKVYEDIFTDIIEKKVRSFDRSICSTSQSTSIKTFLEVELPVELAKVGRSIGGKKGFEATKKSVFNAIKSLACNCIKIEGSRVNDDITGSNSGNGSVSRIDSKEEEVKDDRSSYYNSTNRNIISVFIELYELDGVDLRVLNNDTSAVTSTSSTGDENECKDDGNNDGSDDDADADGDGDGDVDSNNCDAVKLKKAGISGSSSSKVWDWKTDVINIIQNMAGLKKLRDSRPSTAAVGNWAIISCIQRLSEVTALGSCVKARLFMGKKRLSKQKIDVALSKKDSEDVIKSQWDTLCNSFNHTNTVFLFHLKNHYALIFALREWADDGSGCGSCNGTTDVKRTVVTRQLLTARKGQRPSAWIDFNEARDTMINWEGYKIIAIKYDSSLDYKEMRNYKSIVNNTIESN